MIVARRQGCKAVCTTNQPCRKAKVLEKRDSAWHLELELLVRLSLRDWIRQRYLLLEWAVLALPHNDLFQAGFRAGCVDALNSCGLELGLCHLSGYGVRGSRKLAII